MTVLEQALVKLARTLSHSAIPYMIIDGMANAVWGQPRATLDIDATVWVTDEEIDETVSWLQKVFHPLVSDPADFIRETRVLPLESEAGVRIDLIFATLPYEREAIGRGSRDSSWSVSCSLLRPRGPQSAQDDLRTGRGTGKTPAVASGPFVTTANDITGILIYLSISTLFLKYIVTQ